MDEGHKTVPPTDPCPEALARFVNLLTGRSDAYGCENRCVKGSLTASVYQDHLIGKRRIGIYPLFNREKTQWIAVDIDDGDFEKARRFALRCQHYDLLANIEQSKSKGYHDWIFFDQPCLAVHARAVVSMILTECEFTCEVFPKQDATGPTCPYGNYLYLPLFGRDVPNRTIFVDLEGKPFITTVNQIDRLQVTPTKVLEHIVGLNGLDSVSSIPTETGTLTSEVEEVAKECRMISWVRTHQAEVSEPLWYGMISNLVRLPGGVEAAHRFSQDYPSYSPRETDQKIRHALNASGPHTCEWIRGQGFDCPTCPWWGKIKSPVVIAGKLGAPPQNSKEGSGSPLTTRSSSMPPAIYSPIPWPDRPADPAFHGLAGDVVRAIEPHSEADPVALLIQFLVAFGNVIGRGPHFVVEADYHAMNLYLILVGATSKGRKGSSWGHIQRLFKIVDPQEGEERIPSGLSSGEGLIWAVRDPITKREAVKERGRYTKEHQEVVVDGGVSDKRLMVLEPEFASTLQATNREGCTLSPVIRQAWDTGDLRVLTKNSPAKATGAHISIIGHVTKDELLRYLDTTQAGNGFGNRFLWRIIRL